MTVTRRTLLLSSAALAVAAPAIGNSHEQSRTAFAEHKSHIANREGRHFESFLPPEVDHQSIDCSDALAAAASWSAENEQPIRCKGKYLLERGATISTKGATFVFKDAHFLIRDSFAPFTTAFGDTIPIGIYVTGGDLALLGNVSFTGAGEPGKTFLQGIYFEELAHVIIGSMTFTNMAIGAHFMCCDFVQCGDTHAHSMWGLQPSKRRVPPITQNGVGAGTAQVISGCRWSTFGALTATSNDKPARYLAVGRLKNEEARDNINNRYGFVTVTGRQGSPWAQATGIRSSVNSVFEGGTANGVSYLLLCQKYRTDDDYSILGNDFGSWHGSFLDSSGSVDAGVYFHVEPGARSIGKNRISRIFVELEHPKISASERPEFKYSATFGLYCSSGDLEIETAIFSGGMFQMELMDCRVKVKHVVAFGPQFGVLRYGGGAEVEIETLSIFNNSAYYHAGPQMLTTKIEGSHQLPIVKVGQLHYFAAPGQDSPEAIFRDPIFNESTLAVSSYRGSVPFQKE